MALTILQNRGFDLPEFDCEILMKPYQFRAVLDNPGQDKFVRYTQIHAAGFTSLKSCIETADIELQRLADFCGVNVVEHTWGLAKSSNINDGLRRRQHLSEIRLIPKGYDLVAEVNTIDHTPLSGPRSIHDEEVKKCIAFGAGILRYKDSHGLLSDIRTAQFITSGTDRVTGQNGSFLHDIEPRFRTSMLRRFNLLDRVRRKQAPGSK